MITNNVKHTASRDDEKATQSPTMMHIKIRAVEAHKVEGGFILDIPAIQLNNIQHEVLRDLFPHLQEKAHELLVKEALLAALE